MSARSVEVGNGRSEQWTFTSRIENRNSREEDRLVFSGGFYREPLAGRAFSLSTQYFDSRFANGADTAASEAATVVETCKDLIGAVTH